MGNRIVWADIPVIDLERARKFYSDILQVDVALMPGQAGIALLPPTEGGPEGVPSVSADLAISGEGYGSKPSADAGPTIYLNGEPDAQVVLDRVEAAGGKVLQNKTFMGEMVGAIGFFLDTEGNRIGVQSMK